MSLISNVCSFFGSIFGAVFMSIVPMRNEVVVNQQTAINNIRAIYNNSPRNLEENNFPDFVERFGIAAGLDAVVIYRNNEPVEIIPV